MASWSSHNKTRWLGLTKRGCEKATEKSRAGATLRLMSHTSLAYRTARRWQDELQPLILEPPGSIGGHSANATVTEPSQTPIPNQGGLSVMIHVGSHLRWAGKMDEKISDGRSATSGRKFRIWIHVPTELCACNLRIQSGVAGTGV